MPNESQTAKKKERYKVWHSSPNSEDMPHGQASFTISGLNGDTLYECESLAANIERIINSLSKRNAKRSS